MLTITIFCEAAVRKEISDETDRETGRTKQISSVPIHLSIYSPNGMSDITCISLPILLVIISGKFMPVKCVLFRY